MIESEPLAVYGLTAGTGRSYWGQIGEGDREGEFEYRKIGLRRF